MFLRMLTVPKMVISCSMTKRTLLKLDFSPDDSSGSLRLLKSLQKPLEQPLLGESKSLISLPLAVGTWIPSQSLCQKH